MSPQPAPMEMKLEVVPMPVSDVDAAKAFYTEQMGFQPGSRRAPQQGDASRADDARDLSRRRRLRKNGQRRRADRGSRTGGRSPDE
jgi:catechol 2,3-dioxygenase-like lactoylglutathione lyase family enzyme